MHFVFKDVVLLHSGHQHVAAGHVAGRVYITAHRRYVWWNVIQICERWYSLYGELLYSF